MHISQSDLELLKRALPNNADPNAPITKADLLRLIEALVDVLKKY